MVVRLVEQSINKIHLNGEKQGRELFKRSSILIKLYIYIIYHPSGNSSKYRHIDMVMIRIIIIIISEYIDIFSWLNR